MRVLVPDQRLADALAPLAVEHPALQVVVWHIDSGTAPPAADVLVTERPTSPERFPLPSAVPGLRHVHLLSLGYEWIVPHVPPGATVTNSRGAIEDATAELALALVLAALRDLPRAHAQQRAHTWQGYFTGSLHGARVLVLGHGGVGSAVVRRLEPFAPAAVTVTASRARTAPDGRRVHGPEDLPELFRTADVVVVTLPHEASTEGLVGAELLARIPDGGLLVNVGRGAVVDTDALVAELRTGRLRAAMDVVEPEPLPPGHPLWDLPGCLVVPHNGGSTYEFERLATHLVTDQVRRLLTGEPVLNTVLPAG
ncbi:NAD(P)-dependent oxidoreductase [Georgenia alba]|uniref:NAD(P)-dependent oxidoreductase n=1 Tax=Georgenia alba TaxID=2233858 RepID=A0ABW2Q5B5_9MICO